MTHDAGTTQTSSSGTKEAPSLRFGGGAKKTEPGYKLVGVSERIFKDRYALKDAQGEALETTPEQVWSRVSKAIAGPEKTVELQEEWSRKFYEILKDFKFVPGGRILSSAGSGHEVTSYNCFLIEQPKDSRGGIFDNIKVMTEIMARGGGVGVNLSSLRPRGSYIKTVNGTSSGPVSWAELYSVTTADIIQQGGSRRGALMIVLEDDHPDILEFIESKRIDPLTNKPVALRGANISVGISDSFMEAVKADEIWRTQFPTKRSQGILREEHGEDFPIEVKYGKEYKAREIWEAICDGAWRTADPGLFFLERAQKWSNTHYVERIDGCNPCGEIPLPAWGVCNLGAFNLSAYVSDSDSGPFFDTNSFKADVAVAMRFLDNVIDYTYYFLPQNEEAQRNIRRTGLGTMGLADTLIKLGVRYGSPEATPVVDNIFRTLRDAAYSASVENAKEKGAFPKFDSEKYLNGVFIQGLPKSIIGEIREHGIRNASIVCAAPTGTTSLLAGVSSGIEPVFSFVMRRSDRTGESIIYHPLAEQWLQENPGQKLPEYFVEADQLSPEEHIMVQAVVQKYNDQAVSKTINGPNSDTVDDVKRLYMLAYDSGCKGVTYYRDGSRDAVLTRLEAPEKPAVAQNDPIPTTDTIRERPSLLHGYTRNVHAPEGTVNVTVNEDELGPFEVFVNVGKSGSDIGALAEALGRLISLTLRVPSTMTPQQRLEEVANQLSGIGGSRSVGFGPNQTRSLADAVAKVLTQHGADADTLGKRIIAGLQDALDYKQGKTEVTVVEYNDGKRTKKKQRLTGNACPECGNHTLVFEESCKKCISCGYSQC